MNDISNQQDAAKFVLLILLSLLYMCRATVSPIFRSTLFIQLSETMYRLCCLLPTGDTDWTELFHPICVTGRQQTAESVHCSKKLYVQSKCS